MKNRIAKFSIWFLVAIIFVGLFSPFLANQKPYYIKVNNHHYFPIFNWSNQVLFFDEMNECKVLDNQQVDWKHLPYQSAIFPPIAYSASTSDLLNADYKSPSDEQLFLSTDKKIIEMPLQFRHWLGTNKRGEDVASGLINGTSISLLIGMFSMLIAAIFGISAGLIAGYLGNDKLKMKRGTTLFILIGFVLSWFYGFQIRWFILSAALQNSILNFVLQLIFSIIISGAVIFILIVIAKFTINKFHFFYKEIFIPIDSLIIKIIEIMVSLPIMILIISLAAICKPSYFNLIAIIGVLQSANITRIVRAEMLRIKNLDYMQAAEIIGLSKFQIIIKYALPNTISPAISSISFGVAQSILIESSLSFLNVGLPVGVVSWGSLINSGCDNFNAWWLIILPGLAIFITVLIFNILGSALHNALLINAE